MEEFEIALQDIHKYDDSYEVWDELAGEWRDIKSSCYYETGGFPEADEAAYPITAITYKMNDMFIVYGCGHFTNEREDVQYIRCDDEIDLIKRFVDGWSGNYPDIITGWNVKMFDIPYLVNRITKLMGEAFAKRLSPWNYLSERTVNFGVSRQFKTYNLVGISCLDYIDLYQRYAPEGKSQESYKLDNIANVELNERKLSYEEYGNLHTLYRDNYQLFIEYNIKDTELVERLEDKLKLIELALTLAYDSKTNYDDVFAQVRMWDALIYNHLKSKNMVVPPIEHQEKNEAYVGAYVKDPIVGMHNWVASLDLNSLYPSLIMQYNISPEMHMTKSRVQYRMEELEKNVKEMTREELQEELEDLKKIQKITSQVDVNNMVNKEIDLSILKKYNMTITPNGELFEVVSQGFLSEMMEKMYNDRTVYKKKAIEAKKDLEKVMAEINRRKKV